MPEVSEEIRYTWREVLQGTWQVGMQEAWQAWIQGDDTFTACSWGFIISDDKSILDDGRNFH